MAVLRWGQGGTGPQILPSPPFLDTVVLLLVELIGSIVISLKFRLEVVASQMMRGQAPKYFFLEPPLDPGPPYGKGSKEGTNVIPSGRFAVGTEYFTWFLGKWNAGRDK